MSSTKTMILVDISTREALKKAARKSQTYDEFIRELLLLQNKDVKRNNDDEKLQSTRGEE